MTGSSSSGVRESRAEDLARLLKTADGSRQGADGYLDTLGDRDAIGPHAGQQVFRWKFVTWVYEWLWRPLVALVLLGLRGPKAAEERRITVEMLDVSPGDTIVDVGCGPGNYTRELARASAGGLVVGIDASAAMVSAATARTDGENCAYLRGDASALPFRDGCFDAACSVGVVHLLERPMAAVEEMARVLAPGGRLAIGASCARRGKAGHRRGGLTIFGHDELTDALRALGMVDVEQRVFHRGQLVAARKPEEGSNGR